MALERWIALAFLCICCVYGYAAFFTMDGDLPPFMRRNPIWPSTFPKVLAVLGALTSLVILLGLEKATGPEKTPDIDYRRLQDYKLGQALGLIALMVAYAALLRPLGFLGATTAFLAGGGLILGERKLHILIPVAAFAAGSIWWLVQEVLGIFLSPLPSFL
jgi:putative tricarboxylic transport membrane protein